MNIRIASYLSCFMFFIKHILSRGQGGEEWTELGGDPPPPLTIGYLVKVP